MALTIKWTNNGPSFFYSYIILGHSINLSNHNTMIQCILIWSNCSDDKKYGCTVKIEESELKCIGVSIATFLFYVWISAAMYSLRL